ncbi:hypothetical protein DFO69_2845 [Bacillus subtilis]|nr:hypothetical protein DFO69_2845 [Bacillus subtilis]
MSQGIYDKRWEQKFILPLQRAALLNRKRESRRPKNPFSMNTAGGIGTHYLRSDGIQLGSGHQYIQGRFY